MVQKFFRKLWEAELTTRQFIISQILLLVGGLVFWGWLYYLIYGFTWQFGPKNGLDGYKPVTSAPISFNLELNNPDDDSLVFDKSIVVSGKTSPHATIVISVEDKDTALESNSQGDFSKVVVLNSGLNRISVDAFDVLGNTKEIQKLVYFSEEKLNE